MAEAPATELEAVNVILINMGETPVDSLAGDLPLDVSTAQATLHEISRAVQQRGWHWNTEVTTLSPDVSDNIVLPSNCLSVEAPKATDHTVTLRDGLLYRLKDNNNGFTFDDDVEVRYVGMLSYENLPPSAQEYITKRASRIFQARELGDQVLLQKDSNEEVIAWARLRAEENRTARRSLNESYDTQMITNRRGAPIVRY